MFIQVLDFILFTSCLSRYKAEKMDFVTGFLLINATQINASINITQEISRNKTFDAFDCTDLSNHQTFDASNPAPCPDIQTWFENGQNQEIQVLETKKRDEMVVKTCKIRLSKIVQSCGLVTSITYGPTTNVMENKVIKVSEEECRRIHQHQNYFFQDGVIVNNVTISTDTGYHTEDWVPPGHGKRFDTGGCSGRKLIVENRQFDRHTLRYVLNFELLVKTVPFDSVNKVVRLQTQDVPLSHQVKVSSVTTIWDLPHQNCYQSLHEIYKGEAKFFRSNHTGVSSMLLINNNSTNQYFGLQILDQQSICQKTVFATKTSEIYVRFKTNENDWEIDNVLKPKRTEINQWSHIRGFLDALYVTVSTYWPEAFSAITNRICQNERSIVSTMLSIMQFDMEQGE